MKTPFDDAVARLADLAREGFTRGWDRLDRADKHDEIAAAIGGVHAEWTVLIEERDDLRRRYDKAHADCQEMIRLNDEHDAARYLADTIVKHLAPAFVRVEQFTLTAEDREALEWAKELLAANPLGMQSHDPVVVEHNAKCRAAFLVLDRLLGVQT